jgi:serine/threonine protein kinase
MNRYTLFKELGRGRFGVVYKAYDKSLQVDVAIKQIAKSGSYLSREIEILMSLKNCENCIRILDVFFSYTTQLSQFIVFEYVPYTLRDFLIYNHKNLHKKTYHQKVKKIIQKILQGVCYMHSMNIVHRDLKPENILVSCFEDPDIVKICDFGSAKVLQENNNPYVVTRFYRAPELVFGSCVYEKSVDLWAVGCVFVELFVGRPVFESDSDAELFVKQVDVLGKPDPCFIDQVSKFVEIDNQSLNHTIDKLKHTGTLFQLNLPTLALEFGLKMLNWNFNNRISAKECLADEYFK